MMKEICGAWSDEDNGWVSDVVELLGDSWLEIELPEKGRLVIKKSESEDGPWPKALVSRWGGDSFRIRMYGSTKHRFVKIATTCTPTRCELCGI